MSLFEIAALTTWGTLVGVDLVAFPQMMIARPIVAGTVAGWILGDVVTGSTVGIVLELFALEVLPVGAARYADYGVGAVVAAVIATGALPVFGVGLGVGGGLLVAVAGSRSIRIVRRWNSAVLARHESAIDRGDVAHLTQLHLGGLGREGLRGLLLIGLGLGMAAALRVGPILNERQAIALTVVVTGLALGVAIVGGWRLAGAAGVGTRWLGAGLLAGILWVVLS